MFCRHITGNYAIIAAAVDDLTITAPTEAILFGVKEDLIKVFRMKGLGKIHWLLNLMIERDREKQTLSFSQEAYIQKILERFNLQDAKTYASPLDPNIKLTKDHSPTSETEKENMKKIPYRQAIGSLMWTAVATQPDVVFAVSQFLENPGQPHWNAVKRVLGLRGCVGDLCTNIYAERSIPIYLHYFRFILLYFSMLLILHSFADLSEIFMYFYFHYFLFKSCVMLHSTYYFTPTLGADIPMAQVESK